MSYGAKYTVPFRTLSEIPCEIRFDVKEYTGVVKELIGGGDPIKIDVDTSDILVPIRSSSATVSVYGSDYLQDLYTSDPFGIKVTLLVNGVIHWIGYVTQDTFSQDFTNPEFIYEIECVSALSVLKHKKFSNDNPTATFLEIIKDAMSIAGYEKAYLTNTVRTTADGNLYNLAKVASGNFFDELDQAESYYDILQEIAKYTSCTFTPHKGDLMLLNYEAIKAGDNFYYRIDSGAITAVKFEHETTVQTLGYRGTGATISRISGKNKAVVNCSLYETKEMLPSFDDEMTSFQVMEETQSVSQKEKKTYIEIRRYYEQPKFDMFGYVFNTSSVLIDEYVNHEKLISGHLGSQFIRSAVYDIADKPSSLSFIDELLVQRYEIMGGSLNNTRKALTLKSKRKVITNEEVHFCLSLSVMVNIQLFSRNIADVLLQKVATDTVFNLWCKLKLGDKYYNGNAWVATDTRFAVPITVKKGEQVNETYLTVDNTNDFETGLGSIEGFVIKAPDNIQIGYCELTIYTFDDVSVKYPSGAVLDYYIRYKNIKFSHAIPNEQSIYGDYVNEDSRNDVIYEREIVGDYVDEADEVNLKISTKPDGKICLSSVFIDSGYITQYKHLGINIQPEHNILNKIIRLYQQPRFVINPTLANNLKPYSLITDENLPGVQFVNGGGEEDVKMERVTVNLIQI